MSNKSVLHYIAAFLSQYPQPTKAQARIMAADIGLDDQAADEIIDLISKVGAKKISASLKKDLRAYTKVEKVLQDEYDSRFLSPEYLLVNDESVGDSYEFQEELSNDGVEDEESVLDDQDKLATDGFIRL